MWLDADNESSIWREDDGDGGALVRGWRDSSKHHNDALAAFWGSGVGVQSGAINGRPAMRFFRGAFVTDASQQGSFLVVVVAAYRNTPSSDWETGQAILYRDQLDAVYLLANSATDSRIWGGRGAPESNFGPGYGVYSATAGWNDGKFHTFAISYDRPSASLVLRTDGLQTMPGGYDSGSGFCCPKRGAYIGGDPCGGEQICAIDKPLDGYIAEVILVDRGYVPSPKPGESGTYPSAPSAEEVARLGAYIHEKYGLPF